MSKSKKLTSKAPRGKQRIHLMVVVGRTTGVTAYVPPKPMTLTQAVRRALGQFRGVGTDEIEVHHVELVVAKVQAAKPKARVRRTSKAVARREPEASYTVRDKGAYPIRDYP